MHAATFFVTLISAMAVSALPHGSEGGSSPSNTNIVGDSGNTCSTTHPNQMCCNTDNEQTGLINIGSSIVNACGILSDQCDASPMCCSDDNTVSHFMPLMRMKTQKILTQLRSCPSLLDASPSTTSCKSVVQHSNGVYKKFGDFE